MATLLRNPTNIGDIFFSGSQTVTKGDEVTWILSDTWAFKATEECMVSTNKSPFVLLGAGQTFLIYKRTQEDIDAGNSKGIYIFDRDTVVALAYPQDVTQDIIIENDIYNNNLSTIVIEADKTPIAKISISKNPCILGDTVTISNSGYAIAPATLKSYSWKINGSLISNQPSFTYKPSSQASYDVQLILTDSENRLGNTSATLKVNPAPVLEDIFIESVFDVNFVTLPSWKSVGTISNTKSGYGTLELKASVPIWTMTNGSGGVSHEVIVRILKNGLELKRWSQVIPSSNQGFVVGGLSNQSGGLSSGDVFDLQIYDVHGSNVVGNAITQNHGNQQLSIKLFNRTS